MPDEPARILVVDDEEVILDLLRDILGTMDIEVHTASSGDEALQELQQLQIPLIFCDLWMPGLSGPSLVKQMRQMAPQSAIVMMSGSLEDDALRDSVEAGACDAMQKPFHLRDVVEVCHRYLSSRKPA